MRTPGATLAVMLAAGTFVALAWSPRAAAPATAQETTTTTAGDGAQDGAQDPEQLALGSTVFSRTCTGCHQAGGVGLVGQFPPLKDNPNVAGATAYVDRTVREGRQGEIVVNGETYNGVMPAVGAGLSDEEIAAVAAYVSGNLTLPEGVEAAEPAAPDIPGPPTSALVLTFLGFGLAMAVAALVLAPLVLGRTDRLHLSWVDASLKAFVIVAYFVVAVVLVPGRFMELGQVQDLSPDVQYVLGSVVWGGGLLIGLVGLWWARRRGLV
ncbi:MAG TPA: c-type cytochrome [Acidimicrobiales bacterium]|nr:c-type cytochrome [Acidimicrobiales bacterium]